MNGNGRMTGTKWLCLLCCVMVFFIAGIDVIAESVDIEEPIKTEAQLKLEKKAKEQEAEKMKKVTSDISPEEIAQLNLPQDTSVVMSANQLRLMGNTLIATDVLLSNIPLIYNASAVPPMEAESIYLYDLRAVRDIIDMPGQSRQLSARTIQGLTQCILSLYRQEGYSGIYVSVPPETLQEGKLLDDVLVIKVTEAPVSSVTTNYFTPENVKAEKGYLKDSFLQNTSPIQAGEVGKQKKLEEYVNLLNLNPDRYISARVSKGPEPDTLAVGYNVYEANPWHWFVQVDNAGTKDRRYTPRVGLINTNLLGFDDMLTVYYQAPWEKNIEDEYSIYGSYDFPIMGPKLRLELFAGYNEFDVNGGGGIDFLGNGSLYGGKLRYNAFQKDGWFFDLTTSLSRENSKVSSSIFSSVLGSRTIMHLWGVGFDLHRRTDLTNTSVTFDRVENIGGSSQAKFWNGTTGARTNAERDFVIYTTAARHSQYLKADKVQRLTGSVRWIVPNDRLVPSKMTTFGGMYTVRGYKESGIVADGGVLASAQYEFDLVKYEQAQELSGMQSEEKPFVRKLAPLAFFDYGRAEIEDNVAGERSAEDLYSIGVGGLVELGDNFSGAIYYGHPLEATSTTDTHDGRVNLSLMMRW